MTFYDICSSLKAWVKKKKDSSACHYNTFSNPDLPVLPVSEKAEFQIFRNGRIVQFRESPREPWQLVFIWMYAFRIGTFCCCCFALLLNTPGISSGAH